jgi:SsrA-binding protein
MKIVTKNKRAYFDYDIIADYSAGIILVGHEVKSIKTSHVNITDTIISIQKGELWLLGMDIPLYAKTSPNLVPGYQPKRKRKLLVTKRELSKIASQLDKS